MGISGTDDMGTYTDTGEGTLATQRPSTDAAMPPPSSPVQIDTGTHSLPTAAAPRRSTTQRR